MLKPKITAEYAREIINYNPETGAMRWKKKVNRNGTHIGSSVGHIDSKGYLRTTINKTHYRVHQLAWLITYGSFPSGQIDHINRIKTDNRIANLRDVTSFDNAQNKGLRKDSVTGEINIALTKYGKYHVSFVRNKIRYYIGQFDSLNAAIAMRDEACRKALEGLK